MCHRGLPVSYTHLDVYKRQEDGDKVWYIGARKNVFNDYFDSSDLGHIALVKCGWLFKSRDEAEANKDRVFEEYKIV